MTLVYNTYMDGTVHGDPEKLELLFEKILEKNIIFDYKNTLIPSWYMCFRLFTSFLPLYSVFCNFRLIVDWCRSQAIMNTLQ